MHTNAVATPGGVRVRDGADPSVARLLLRFGVGFAAVAGERLVAGLRALQPGRPHASDGGTAAERPAPPESDGGTAAERPAPPESDGGTAAELPAPPESDGGTAAELPELSPRHALLGALVTAPGALARAATRVAPATRGLGRLARRGRGIVGRLPGSEAAARHIEPWRARAALALGRLAVIGRAEEAEGRALARGAVKTTFQATTAAIADSPEVKRVIAEQSQGLAISAIAALRVRSARADSVVESAARRLLGRRRAGRSE
jgi:hypothetical protein